MTTQWLGGGLMIALAAVLWLVYLLPSWFKSRQYLATERNAVRLQQTLRILAETAEVPDEVRIEANAKSVLEQQRLLRQVEVDATPAAVRVADRLRRSRAITAAVLALSIAIAVLGGMQAVYTGAWIFLAGGAVASVICVMVLVRLAKASRGLRIPLPAEFTAPAFVDHAEGEQFDDETDGDASPEVADAGGWTPVPLPSPLYLRRAVLRPIEIETGDDEADDADADLDADATDTESSEGIAAEAHRASLLRAAAEAEQALRERMRAEEQSVVRLPVAAAASGAPSAQGGPVPSRFARMGIVGEVPSELNLDEVLARRRAG
jgi:hypothetical protein